MNINIAAQNNLLHHQCMLKKVGRFIRDTTIRSMYVKVWVKGEKGCKVPEILTEYNKIKMNL